MVQQQLPLQIIQAEHTIGSSNGSFLTPYLRRYYFVVEEDNTPLSVTVTPCDAPLEWKLTLQELPEEASGEASGRTDLRQP